MRQNVEVTRISKLTKNAKEILRAYLTNLFRARCSVTDNARSLFFKNQNAYNQSFKMRYFKSLYHMYFLRKLKKSTKKRMSKTARIETNVSR